MPPVKKNILVDGRPLLDPQSGGVFEYESELLAALRLRGADNFRVWTNAMSESADYFQASGASDARTRWPNRLLNTGIKLLNWPKIDRLAQASHAPDADGPDLFWAPNPNFIALSSGIPLALTVHDLAFEKYPEFFSMKQRLWHMAVDLKRSCRRADIVLAVSEHTKNDLVSLYGIAPEKIAVTHLGYAREFDHAPTADELAAVRKKYGLPERFIIQIGALEPRKNHLATIGAFHAIKSISRFADLGLVFVGPKGWRNREVVSAIAHSPWRRQIKSLGFVDRAEKAVLCRMAAVLSFPSYYEGFGLPVLEAMASGTPVVASFTSSLGEIIEGAGILTDPYRPNELAEALVSVLDSSSLTRELSARGLARAGKFSWDRCAELTSGAFSAVAK